jgi:hypothetical protein
MPRASATGSIQQEPVRAAQLGGGGELPEVDEIATQQQRVRRRAMVCMPQATARRAARLCRHTEDKAVRKTTRQLERTRASAASGIQTNGFAASRVAIEAKAWRPASLGVRRYGARRCRRTTSCKRGCAWRCVLTTCGELAYTLESRTIRRRGACSIFPAHQPHLTRFGWQAKVPR